MSARAATAGFVLVCVVWVVILIPIVRGLYMIMRTTRPKDLIPRIIRVPKDHVGAIVVSGERARFDPAQYVQISPWCWRKKA